MPSKSRQSGGGSLPLSLRHVLAQRCPRKWSPNISWQCRQLARHELRTEADLAAAAAARPTPGFSQRLVTSSRKRVRAERTAWERTRNAEEAIVLALLRREVPVSCPRFGALDVNGDGGGDDGVGVGRIAGRTTALLNPFAFDSICRSLPRSMIPHKKE